MATNFSLLDLERNSSDSIFTNSMSSRLARGLLRVSRPTFLRFNSSKSDLAAKYQAKLQQKAQELGLKDVEQLKTSLKDELDKKKKEFSSVDPLAELEEYERRQAADAQRDRDNNVINVRSPIEKGTPKEPFKTLNLFIDLEKARVLPKKELELIWRARFLSADRAMNASLSAVQFSSMYVNAFKNPSFILPLPKGGEGYEMHFVQWSFVGPQTTYCMFTTVAEYKLHKEYAKPHTTLMFHQDLAQEAGVVLMNGQVEEEASLTMDEAQLLVMNTQRFYGGLANQNEKKLQLLRDFTAGSENFTTDELINEATSFE